MKIKNSLLSVAVATGTLAGMAETASEWPFAILRSYGSYENNRDFFGRMFAAQERHPGLFGEIWFGGADAFGDPDKAGDETAKGNLAAKPICERLGIRFSYQQGVTLNHAPDDQMRPDIPEDAWAVDRSGKRRGGLFCCTSPFAIDYAYRKSKSIMSALKPDSYWPDDDLRILKVDWSKPGICFCPRCLALFGERTGKTYGREALLAELDAGSPRASAATRAAWCAFNGEMLANYAKAFRRAADEASPATRLGLQAACSRYTANGDLVPRVVDVFAGEKGQAGVRPGGGYYSDFDMRDYFLDKMIDIARDAARVGRLPKTGQVCYECENWPHVGAIKNPGSMMAECALALGFGCDSIAFYWGADQNGEAAANYDFWLETVHAWRPFHLAVRDAFRGLSLGGVAVCHGAGFLATDGWFNRVDDNLTRLARNGLPVTVTEAEPDALIVNERSVGTLAKGDLAKVFSGATLTDPAGFAALVRRFPELAFTRKLEVRVLEKERALSTSRRDSGYELVRPIGKCENVKALIYPKGGDVVRFSEMTVDPKACGTCVVPTEFGGRLVVAQDLSGLPPHLNWPGCRRHAILDALDAAVPGGMPARLVTDGYALAMAVRKDASGRTAGVLLMNLGLGETPPLELAIRRGVGDAWQVMLPKGGPSPAEVVRRSAGETVIRLPSLQAWQPVLVMPR